VIELDRHIEILLLNNDCVILPNFGGFMAHHVEARRDDSDGTFLPPLRTIGFNPKLTLNDSLLAQSYVEAYDLSYPDAVMRIADEVRELKQHLDNDGSYELCDIGVLRLNDDGQYEFEPCEAGILTPSLYGLGNFEMKTVAEIDQELEAAHVAEQVASTPTLTLETQPLAAIADEVEGDASTGNRQLVIWRNLAVACITLLVFLLFPAPLSNNGLVQESRIDTSLLQRILPKNITTGENRVREAVAHRAEKSIQPAAVSGSATLTEQPKEGYTLVLASRITRRNAAEYASQLQKQGYDQAEVYTKGKSSKVVYGDYKSQNEALAQLNRLHDKEIFSEAWVMKR
jgi:hypothetical protein